MTAKLALLSLAAVAAFTDMTASAAPTESGDVKAQLREAQRLVSPASKLDYSIFQADLTATQQRTLARVVTAEATDEQKKSRVNALFARRAPARPEVGASDIERIKDAAVFASIAYCGDARTIGSWMCGTKCSSARAKDTRPYAALTASSTFGYVALREAQKQIIISFRGSSNAANWADNLEFGKSAWPYKNPGVAVKLPSVHKGFADAYGSLRSQVFTAVRTLTQTYPAYSVLITGHSLGGAMAALCAADLVAESILPASKVSLLSFASPRIGDKSFSEFMRAIPFARAERFTEGNDMVPHLPPASFGFEHHQGEMHGFEGKAYACSGDEDGECMKRYLPFVSVSAHDNFLNVDNFFGSGGCSTAI